MTAFERLVVQQEGGVLFGQMVRAPEAQRRIAAAMERGLQTREAELSFDRVLSSATLTA
jgi:hypothetical protein